MVLNEASLKYMGFKDPVGKTVIWQGYPFTVIGVVKDMVMESPYETPVPALFYVAPYSMSYLTIRINPRMGAQEAMARLAPVFVKYNPAEPFDFKFVDLEYDAKFREEIRIGQLAGFFTVLAIFISCLGLFGLASLCRRATHQRNRNPESAWGHGIQPLEVAVPGFRPVDWPFLSDFHSNSLVVSAPMAGAVFL